MTKIRTKAAQTRKAIGTAIVGVYSWAGLVVMSAPARITASEWLVLGGVGVSVAAVYGLTNDPAAPTVQVTTKPIDDINRLARGGPVLAPTPSRPVDPGVTERADGNPQGTTR